MQHIDDALREMGCKGLLVLARSSDDPSIAPFLGGARLADTFLLHPAGGRSRLALLNPMEREEAARSGLELLTPERLDIARWRRDYPRPALALAATVSRALQLVGLAPGALALAGRQEAGRLLLLGRALEEEGWSFLPGEEILARLRKRKRPEELREIRRVAAGTMAAFRRVAALLAAADAGRGGRELWLGGERLRVGRLKAEIALALAGHRLEQPEESILAPAEEGAVPHSTGTEERVLRSGESLVVDLFPKGRLFADCTRTFCAGEPPPELTAAHAAVRGALARARELCRPGLRGWVLQEAVSEHLSAAGYPTQLTHPDSTCGYVHGLGHGVGYEVHEPPFFSEEASEEEGLIEAGDVFTLEPGLYDEGARYGVRLEDLCAFDEEGSLHDLTPLPYELDPRAW